MSATTSKLQYSNVPPRATSSRAIRQEVIPSNGSTFTMSNTIIFDVPSNLNNTFADFQSSYIKMNIKNNDGAPVFLPAGGAPGLIRRITLELGGQTLFSCDNWNTLYAMMISLDTSEGFRSNTGKRLFGSSGTSAFVGQTIVNAQARDVCFPLILTPLTGMNKYFPLISRDRLRIRIEFDSAIHALTGAAGLLDSQIVFSEVSLVMYTLELGSSVMAQVASTSGGQFKIAMPSYQHHQTQLGASDTGAVATLGFSMSSLNRVLVAQTPQGSTVTKNNIDNRSRLALNRAFITIGGVKYPQRDLRETGITGDFGAGSEILAEALISQRSLCSWSHDSSVELNGSGGFSLFEDDGSTSLKTGSYVLDIDLESQRVSGNENSLGLIAGINTIGQIVQMTFEYTTSPTAVHLIDVFGEHTILCMLDLNTLTWQIAI